MYYVLRWYRSGGSGTGGIRADIDPSAIYTLAPIGYGTRKAQAGKSLQLTVPAQKLILFLLLIH